MEELVREVQQAGLSEKEAEVYVGLVKHGPCAAGTLAKYLGLDRTHTYNLLKNLEHKGLAGSADGDDSRIYAAAKPENLLNDVDARRERILAAVPLLKRLRAVSAEPEVIVLRGKAGMRSVIRELLRSEGEILVLGGTGRSYDALPYDIPRVERQVRSRKMRMLTAHTDHRMVRIPGTRIRPMPETRSSTIVFGDTVAISTFDPIAVVCIKNAAIAESYRVCFELLWRGAENS